MYTATFIICTLCVLIGVVLGKRLYEHDIIWRLEQGITRKMIQGNFISLMLVSERNVNTQAVLDEVQSERKRQDSKWGKQDHPPALWFTILGEEVGEVAEAILEGKSEECRKELIQVAAVAVSTVECYDRNNTKLQSETAKQLKLKERQSKANV